MFKNLSPLFQETRLRTEEICSHLQTEDYVVQPIVDVSPPKWHLGHTTWFFEEFLLKPHHKGYKLYNDDFAYVFNSYYESVGKKVVRANRGNLSRPTVEEVYKYRKYVTEAMVEFLNSKNAAEFSEVIEIGIHHEKQHQELLMTDIKYILGNNPLLPKYNDVFEENTEQNISQEWKTIPEGVYEIGHEDENSFCYDNELGAHKVYLNEFSISKKQVTNAEYLEFINAGGYDDVLLWHAEGWDWKNQNKITAPDYWHKIDGKWHQYTFQGLKPLNLDAPLSHVSFFEAYAFSRWKKMRLPTEFEWEIAQQHFEWGSRWEWTESAYLPYPNYKIAEGAIGEYNGKFMVNQKVLRGASVATAAKHTRHTYRNFFHPQLRWQFTGIRLVK